MQQAARIRLAVIDTGDELGDHAQPIVHVNGAQTSLQSTEHFGDLAVSVPERVC